MRVEQPALRSILGAVRIAVRVLASVATLYLATYAALSSSGTYERQVPQEVWHAKWCWSKLPAPGESRSTSLVGKVFYPLIVTDASLWHRTRPVIWDPL
jgi:hypothetical protein